MKGLRFFIQWEMLKLLKLPSLSSSPLQAEFPKQYECIKTPSKRHRKWNFGEKFLKTGCRFDKDFFAQLL